MKVHRVRRPDRPARRSGSRRTLEKAHFGHTNIIEYDKRPYVNAQEMNEDMIARWNGVVGENDIVYHLGDIFLCKNAADARAVRARLNGTIRLIRGNHDAQADSMRAAFDWVKDYYELSVPDPDGRDGKQLIVLCHYAFRVWNKSHFGAYHLYGHSHGMLADDPASLSFDVGCMLHGYAPISYARVKEIMAAKTWQSPLPPNA